VAGRLLLKYISKLNYQLIKYLRSTHQTTSSSSRSYRND